MATKNQAPDGGRILRLARNPLGIMAAALPLIVLAHFDFDLSAMVSDRGFLVGLATGAVSHMLFLELRRSRAAAAERGKEEAQFASVMDNKDKLVFSRRVGDLVFFDYLDKSLIVNVKTSALYIFQGDQCLVTSNAIQERRVVRGLLDFLNESFGAQIEDCVVVNGVAYSRRMIEFYTGYLQSSTSGLKDHLERMSGTQAEQPPMSVDQILDKISRQGLSSLSREEMEFLKSQR